jgi:hypothetical protein
MKTAILILGATLFLALNAQARPLILASGTIRYTLKSATSPQDTRNYEALVTIRRQTAGFSTQINASEHSLTRTESLGKMTCQTDNTPEILSDYTVISEKTVTAQLSTTVQADVSADLDGDRYQLTLHLPAVEGGQQERTRHTTYTGGCKTHPAIPDHHAISPRWRVEARSVEFKGRLNPADLSTLQGETTVGDLLVSWNLKR